MTEETTIGILPILILISTAQCLFLSAVFFFRGAGRASSYLAAFGLMSSIMLVDGFMTVTNYYSEYPHLTGAVWPVLFLLQPLLYFHVRELSSPKWLVISWHHIFYFLPSIASALLLILFNHMKVNTHMPKWLFMIGTTSVISPNHLNGLHHLAVLQYAVYSVLSYLLFRDYRSRIKHSYSSYETSNLSWLRALLLINFCCLFLCIFIYYVAVPLGIGRESTYFNYLIWTVAIFILAYKVIIHPNIILRIEVAHQTELSRTDPDMVPDMTAPGIEKSTEDPGTISRGKYQRTCLTDERAAGIAHQLLELMETKKPYLEPELMLTELADKLAVPPHHLSQVINREMKKNFFDFVNEYRVQEAKRLLRSPQSGHLSILGIALDAGFNSKSAFYTAFGKYAGMKPSDFRKQLRSSGHGAVSNDQ